MDMRLSGNPLLGEGRMRELAHAVDATEAMTFNGALNKTGLLFLILLLGAAWTWADIGAAPVGGFSGKMIIGLVGGLILALVTVFKMAWAPYTAPAYAFFQGMFLGGLSAYFEGMYPGIVLPAVALTFGILIGMLATYRAGLIPVTQKFRIGVLSATGGIALFYLASIVLGMFGIQIPFLFEGGILGIGFSLFVIVIATLNLIIDFDMIDRMSDAGMPRQMEWYGAFALMVTLIWLYLEILRLLAKTRD
jgi:uncharacterized YccA/Bax inhibitor family protein